MGRRANEILCERCGYHLRGLSIESACPECGLSVARSHPGRRRGSPWQVRPGFRTWASTFWLMLRHPWRAWEVVRIEPRRSAGLLAANLSAAGLVLTGALLPGPLWSPRFDHVAAFLLLSILLLAVLTSIEFAGIRIFGVRRGYRITRQVALTVCAHASAAWLISGLGAALVAQGAQRFGVLWNATLRANVPLRYAAPFMVLTAAAFLAGMVWFSILCGLGYRALRYANRAGDEEAVGRGRAR